MANELKHKSQGSVLTQAEYENIDAHILDNQATGDIIYASSATQLSRLAIGAENTTLQVASGGIPEWVNAPVFTTGTIIGNLTFSNGSITDSSGTISFDNENLTTTGVITGETVEATGDTAAGDNSALGYTSTEGAILTGQGSTSDVTIKNDADGTVISIPTGTTNVKLAESSDLMFGSTAILSDSSGDMTLSNIDALDATTETTIEGAIDTLDNLTSASSLATVGTITSGTWQGTTVAVDQGGTGATTLNNLITLGTHTTGNYVTDITAGALIDVSGGGSETATVAVAVDLSELTDMTETATSSDEMVILDSSSQKRKALGEIGLSVFNDDLGYTTGDITAVNTGTGLTGGDTSGAVTINLDFASLTDMTGAEAGTDELVILDAGTEKRKAISEINLSSFNDDLGYASGDITAVNPGTGLSGGGTSGSVTLDVNASLTHVTAVGALDAGSITSGFTSIDMGSGTIDTTGAVSTGALTAAGVVDITDTTDATDATGDTGALRTEGGASIAKKLYVGTDLDVDGTAELDNITIGGAQGSDGQVLTSTGSGVAWEDAAGGGGTADFVASGSISNGDHVALNADGTVSVISAGTRPVVAFESGSGDTNETRAYSGCFDTTSNKVVVAYIDQQQSNKGYAVVGTIASGAITFGTPVVFSSNYLLESDGATACTFGRYDPSDSATGRVVITFMDHTADNDAFAIVGTVSGTSISFGTAVEFEDTERAWDFRACWDSDNDRAVIAWIQNSGDATPANRRGKAIVGTVSGTSITFGTEVVFEDAQTYMGGMSFDSNTNRVVITYVDAGDSSYGKAIVGQVASTGNSISFGTAATYNSSNTTARRCAFDSNVNKVAIMYKTSDGLFCKVGTVTGGSTNSIAFGSEVRIDYSTSDNSHLGIDFDSNSNKMLITYTADGDGYFSVGTLSGTTSTWTFPAMYEEGASAGSGSFYNTPVFDSNSNLFANMYLRDDLHYPQARSRIFDSLVTDNYTFWVGVATAAISDGATGAITMQGGVNESQSGLITGYKYYVSDTATVSTTYKANREVGIALSATKLLLTQGGISS